MSRLVIGPSSDGPSSCTLRARLSSQGHPTSGPAVPLPPPPENKPKQDDYYQHFRNHFVPAGSITDNPYSNQKNVIRDANRALVVQLGESFAQAGQKLHTSVVEQLFQAQLEILSKISTFSKLSSSILSNIDDLYSHISYPLSATLCHSINFPLATIASHLANAQEKLRHAENELRSLKDEWEGNLRSEDDLRQELNKEPMGQAPQSTQRLQSRQAEEFKKEAEKIVREKIMALDDIEAHYKELIQAEMIEMVRFISAD